MSWIERQLDDLADDGYFDDLPGSGRPIADIDVEYSPKWWAARWLQRDALRRDLPGMRRRLEADVATALALPRHEARQRLASIGRAIHRVNRHLDSVERIPALDVDEVIIHKKWPTEAKR